MNLKKILLAGLCSAFFIGCMTPKKELRIYNNYRSEHREEFATDCGEAFPITPEYIQGENIIVVDTFREPGKTIDCPPAADGTVKQIKCPEPTIIRTTVTRVDTFTKPNIAKETGLILKAERLQKELDTMTGEWDKEKKKALARLWIAIGLGAALAVGIYLKITK